MNGRTSDRDHVEVTPVPIDRELYRYRGPRVEFEFYADNARVGGQTVERAGDVVQSVELRYLRWAGQRAGDPVSDKDRALMADALRGYYRRRAIPFDFHHPSGEIEDETGRLRPGFASALPHASHSDGWSLEDLWLTPEFPDASIYPPTITYRDAEGEAVMIRSIEVVGGTRQRVLVPGSLRWIGSRSTESMSQGDRDRIFARIRSVYDHRGAPFRIE